MTRLTNWSGNVAFGAPRVHRPETVEQLQEIVAGAERVRALGTAHSFNPIADTTGDLVSTTSLPALIELAPDRSTVTVSAGMSYAQVAAALQAEGLALHNLGSLPHISVAGACATGTHGSGATNGNLSTAVAGLQLVRPGGDLESLDRTNADFAGSVVALGALGIATSVTLDVEPSYAVRQYVYEGLPIDGVADHLNEVLDSAYSVSVFTDWADTSINNQIWLKQKVFDDLTVVPTTWHGAHLADGPRHPVPGMSPDNCTDQLGVPGPWNERLPHFRAGFQPSSGDEIQAEFFVPTEHAAEAFEAVRAVRDQVVPVLQITEIRAIAADSLWLSPASGRDTVAIHFTFTLDAVGVGVAVAAVERALEPFAPRPHWGKVFSLEPAVIAGTYPALSEFRALVGRVDPEGKLRNDFLDHTLTLSR